MVHLNGTFLINVVFETHIHERVFWKHTFQIPLLFCKIYGTKHVNLSLVAKHYKIKL